MEQCFEGTSKGEEEVIRTFMMSATPPLRYAATFDGDTSSTDGSPLSIANCRILRFQRRGEMYASHTRMATMVAAEDEAQRTSTRSDIALFYAHETLCTVLIQRTVTRGQGAAQCFSLCGADLDSNAFLKTC